ncbi:MAG TPA: hypothetical protein VN253_17230 [Kofleriaceae bacterium]|nr:hypothetical protein [Kofleriaceae bacterium]
MNWEIYNRLDEAEEKDTESSTLVKLLCELPSGQYSPAAAAFFAAASA